MKEVILEKKFKYRCELCLVQIGLLMLGHISSKFFYYGAWIKVQFQFHSVHAASSEKIFKH